MKVTILSMSQAQYYVPQGKSAIVRVSDGGYELESLNHPYQIVLSMSFYDIEPRVGLPSNWNWFNMSDGKMLIKLFDEINLFDELVIHCHAGVSRSPAIAIAYAWYRNDLELINKIKDGNYHPNMQVLNIMSRLIFKDIKVARNKLDEISNFYKSKVQENNSRAARF